LARYLKVTKKAGIIFFAYLWLFLEVSQRCWIIIEVLLCWISVKIEYSSFKTSTLIAFHNMAKSSAIVYDTKNRMDHDEPSCFQM